MVLILQLDYYVHNWRTLTFFQQNCEVPYAMSELCLFYCGRPNRPPPPINPHTLDRFPCGLSILVSSVDCICILWPLMAVVEHEKVLLLRLSPFFQYSFLGRPNYKKWKSFTSFPFPFWVRDKPKTGEKSNMFIFRNSTWINHNLIDLLYT